MSTSSRKKVRILHKLKIFVDSILNKQKLTYNGKSFAPFICPVFGSYNAERASSTSFDLWTLCTRDSDDVVFCVILRYDKSLGYSKGCWKDSQSIAGGSCNSEQGRILARTTAIQQLRGRAFRVGSAWSSSTALNVCDLHYQLVASAYQLRCPGERQSRRSVYRGHRRSLCDREQYFNEWTDSWWGDIAP